MSYIFVDVEAYGVSPINGRMTEFGAVDYKTRKTFHGVIWDSSPNPENPAVPLQTDKLVRPVYEVMRDFDNWLKSLGKGRPVFVSDNPAYDWQWISAAFDTCGMENPFGHSGRRIADFWAGINMDFTNTQEWKRFRTTVHDHNPVNDAMGNVEAFEVIQNYVKARTGKLGLQVGVKLKVGNEVTAIGNYWDEQLGEYAYEGIQKVTEVKDFIDGLGNEQQWVKVNHERDDWINSQWFVRLK